MQLLNIEAIDDVLGKKFSETAIELSKTLSDLKHGEDTIIRNSDLSVYRFVRSSFFDRGFNHPFILIEELTQELNKLEKESYEKIIRMMSHEVNNSIGAVGSTMNVISDILRQSQMNEWTDVLPAVDASIDRCNHLAQFVSNLAHVVKIPEPFRSYTSLNELAKSVDALTRMECQRRNIELILDLTDKNPLVHVDGIQFEQVFVNIVKNAYESIGTNGEIRIITRTNPTTIIIQDNGKGITAEVKAKLFSSFFTTKSGGQGIGLMFVREVLTNHKCKFNLSTENGYTQFCIVFQ